MAQPMRCDEHPDAAGLMLVQNLVEGTVNVACAECVPGAVRALADACGVSQEIWTEAQAALIEEVERGQAKAERRTRPAKKTAPAPAEPEDAVPEVVNGDEG